jgi:hypothetical protein
MFARRNDEAIIGDITKSGWDIEKKENLVLLKKIKIAYKMFSKISFIVE